MASAEALASAIPLPERVDRRMGLGPFRSVRDALRFVAYAAAGALVIPWAGAWAWLPVVGVAFLIAVWRPDGIGIDERVGAYVAWALRTAPGEVVVSPGPAAPKGAGTLRVAPGYRIAIVRCGGTPVAFLPTEELQRRFREFREFLRGNDGGIGLHATGAPIDARPWLPAGGDLSAAERKARDAYAEMTTLLCRHRTRRRIYVLLWERDGDAAALGRLEDRVRRLSVRLQGWELEPLRLEGRPLLLAARRFGWREGGGP